MNCPAEEQETVIVIDRVSGIASIWTSDVTMMTKLNKLYSVIGEEKVKNKVWAKKYKAPAKNIIFKVDHEQKPKAPRKRKGNPENIIKEKKVN